MMQIRLSHRFTVRAFLMSAFAVYALLLPAMAQRAEAQGRVSDAATPATVGYHLRVTYVDGANAGRVMDAGVLGLLDATGTLTATLLATSGMTASVTGTLGKTPFLTVTGKATTMTLGGKALRRGGAFGGTLALSDGTPSGSWLLTPELAASSVEFAGVIRSGKLRGTTLSGTLSLMADRAGRFDGSLALDDGSIVAAEGRMAFGNLQVMFYLPSGTIMGIAPRSTTILNNAVVPSFNGTFVGPGTGDRGTWTAIPNS